MMQDVFIEKAEALRRYLQKTEQEVDLQACFFNFTFDSIMKIFFAEAPKTRRKQMGSLN